VKSRKKRRVAGLSFPSDGLTEVHDVGEDDVTGSDGICGFCGELREAHFEGTGTCGNNDCKRFRSA
jgi:hypothetical protein